MSVSGRILRWPGSITSLFAGANFEQESNSLFLEILDWMLAPLLLLWPISIALTNHYAHQIADQPYDLSLIESVQAVSRQVETTPLPNGSNGNFHLPRATQIMLTGNGVDSRFFRITSTVRNTGTPLNSISSQFSSDITSFTTANSGESRTTAAPAIFDVGSGRIPIADEWMPPLGRTVYLRDDTVGSDAVRVAYRVVRTGVPVTGNTAGTGPAVLVQVAETRNEREALVSRIIRGVLLPQFALIPLVAILSYLGLSHGLQPLRRLREKIVGRRQGDLSPLAADQAPEEVRPLLHSLNEMMRRLEVNLEAQQRFIADAAHQLRTPLTGLKMQADLAADENDPVRLQKSLRLIAQSTDRAAHLTKQLLMLARTESSHDKLHRVEPCDLRMLARAVTIEWAERAMAKNIDLAFECGEWPHMIEGVPLLLRELLSNLVDNAIKYTPPQGRVTVRVRPAEFLILEVEDTGPGIAMEEREKVFERFYRVLGNDESGSGLGLPIVREIAERHRARVELLGGDAGGSLFRVSFVRRGGVASPIDLRPD